MGRGKVFQVQTIAISQDDDRVLMAIFLGDDERRFGLFTA
jgi:hypothetical protein